ncbi:MAG: hypothetical protein CMK09_02225 [Ponticaulis sp.]|nr:hypothetical protein [Ponticaulis sp.]|tara:strand:+ start:61314 stop:61754 length:441 start_codon:yes stop_codon:yes gene_type:complete
MMKTTMKTMLGAALLAGCMSTHSLAEDAETTAAPMNYVSGVIVIVSDIDATTEFLTDALGMSVVRNADTERYKETIIGADGGANLALIQMLQGESSVGPARIVFNTKDAPASSAAMKAAGFEVSIDRPTFVLGKDGDGNQWEFIQR